MPLFQPVLTYPPLPGIAVGSGDFNADGRQDAAMTYTGQLLIYLQNANGSLAFPVSYPASSNPIALGVADLNGDRRTDIVVADFVGNTISVYLQQAGGTLAPRVTYPTGLQPDALAVGDVNGDGLADVVVSHWNTASIGVFLQNPGGLLDRMVSYEAPLAGYDDIAIGDVNGDGRNDVVKMNGQGGGPRLSVYLQNAGGSLDAALPYSSNCDSCVPGGLAIGDVTADGRADILVSYGSIAPESNIDVLAQAPDGSLQPAVSYTAHDVPEPLKLADLNGDGLLDVVTAHGYWGAGFSIYLQPLSAYSFYNLPPHSGYYEPGGLAIGDLNGDNRPDILVAGADGLLVSYHTTGEPPQTKTSTPTTTPTATVTPPVSASPTPDSTPGQAGG
jgi:hypothetical protein